MANDMNPTDWGWKEGSHQFIPIVTEKNAARDELLQEIDIEGEQEDDDDEDTDNPTI